MTQPALRAKTSDSLSQFPCHNINLTDSDTGTGNDRVMNISPALSTNALESLVALYIMAVVIWNTWCLYRLSSRWDIIWDNGQIFVVLYGRVMLSDFPSWLRLECCVHDSPNHWSTHYVTSITHVLSFCGWSGVQTARALAHYAMARNGCVMGTVCSAKRTGGTAGPWAKRNQGVLTFCPRSPARKDGW